MVNKSTVSAHFRVCVSDMYPNNGAQTNSTLRLYGNEQTRHPVHRRGSVQFSLIMWNNNVSQGAVDADTLVGSV